MVAVLTIHSKPRRRTKTLSWEGYIKVFTTQAQDTQAPIPCQPQFIQEHCHTIGGGANIRCIVIPTPSNTASRQAHPIAEFLMDRAPPAQLALYYKEFVGSADEGVAGRDVPLTAREPPVKNPANIALQLALSQDFRCWMERTSTDLLSVECFSRHNRKYWTIHPKLQSSLPKPAHGLS